MEGENSVNTGPDQASERPCMEEENSVNAGPRKHPACRERTVLMQAPESTLHAGENSVNTGPG